MIGTRGVGAGRQSTSSPSPKAKSRCSAPSRRRHRQASRTPHPIRRGQTASETSRARGIRCTQSVFGFRTRQIHGHVRGRLSAALVVGSSDAPPAPSLQESKARFVERRPTKERRINGGGIHRIRVVGKSAEQRRPLGHQLGAVSDQKKATEMGRRALTLEVRQLGAGFVHHAVTAVQQGKTQIHVLVVGRKVPLIETSDLVPSLAVDQQTVRRDVVHVARRAVFRRVRGKSGSHVSHPAVAPQDRAGFLERAVGRQDLPACRGNLWVPLDDVQQSVNETSFHETVVIQE